MTSVDTRPDFGEVGYVPDRGPVIPPKKRTLTEKVSFGHVMMILAGLIAAVGTLIVLQDRTEVVVVYVAKTAIAPGTEITQEIVTEVELAADSPLIDGLASAADLSLGRVTAQRMEPGDPITASILVEPKTPSGLRAMSIPVDVDRAVGGDLVPGDRIDVVLSAGADPGVGSASAFFVARDLEVLSTSRSAVASGGGVLRSNQSGGYFIVVAVDADASLQLAVALDSDFSVIRSTGAPDIGAGVGLVIPETLTFDELVEIFNG